MAKSPAFQFYVKDWLASTKVRLMTPEQRGGYTDLLCHTWNEDDCSLPDDDKKLAVLSGLFDKWDTETSDAIKPCFDLQDGRLVHLRLLEEKKKQDDWREKCSEAGKKSAELRKNKGLEFKGGPTSVQPKGQLKGNSSVCSLQSSSASSSTSSKKTKDKDSVPQKRFVKPSLEEVKAYCKERGNSVDPEAWIAFYESNGWRVGKNPMKAWKSAVITWEKRDKNTPQAHEVSDMTKKEIARYQKSIARIQHDLDYIEQLPEDELTDTLRAEAKRYRADIARDEAEIRKLEG